jgi:hypothetical protein
MAVLGGKLDLYLAFLMAARSGPVESLHSRNVRRRIREDNRH